MHGRSGVSQEWSVHAQLTISHHQPAAPDIPPPPPSPPHASSAAQPTEHDSPGVHMQYSWGRQPPSSPTPPPPPPQPPPSLNIPPRTCYGFQRGNILFTTRPPPQESPSYSTSVLRSIPHLLDSGYSSEQVSPGSYASLPTRRFAQPYNRRCKSTCSIVLSGAEHQGVTSASMRPNVDNGQVGCSDLGCFHHQHTSPLPNHKQSRPRSSDFGPVPEICEVCGGGRSPTAIRRAAAANTFTTHFCTHVPERLLRDVDKASRDAASQTSDNLLSATSAGTGVTSVCRSKPVQPKMGNKVAYGGTRRKTDSELLQLPVINAPEPDTEHTKPVSRSSAHRLTRSPARLRGQSPLLTGGSGHRSRGLQCSSNQPGDKGQHKPRTVHIDVYCTGSEDADASASSDDSEEISDSLSSPQTVFESDKLRVVHARMGKDRLPAGYLHQQQRQRKAAGVASRRSESFKYEVADISKGQDVARGYDSDDGLSSVYPSQMSATEASLQQSEVTTSASRNPSWSTLSSSSIALSNEYDSAAATSWKDTVTGLDSLVQSTLSLAQSDSFEYADAADRLRIRQKERAWAITEGDDDDDDGSKTWRSPHVERKHLLQDQKFREFLEKRLGKSALALWKTETTEDSDDDDTGDAWSFCSRETELSPRPTGKGLKREDTVKRVNSGKGKDEVRLLTSAKGAVAAKAAALLKPSAQDSGSLSDSCPHRLTHRLAIGPFGCRAPSPPPSKVATSVTSPFTNIPGKQTDQLSKAEKFGKTVGTFLKPGHHVGPSKNPECACEHCRKYYEDCGYRTRTRSVGDMPLDSAYCNWRNVQSHNREQKPTTAGGDSDVESSIAEDVSTGNEK